MNIQEHHIYYRRRAEGLLNPLRALVHHLRWWLQMVLRPGNHVLDFGMRPGFLFLRIVKMLGLDGHVTAVDIQPEMLEKLEAGCRAQGLVDKITAHLQPHPERIGLSGAFDLI